jgi:hypothetical protein
VVGVLLIAFVVKVASSGTVKTHLGTPVFDAGQAVDLARQIDTPGPDGRSGPILLQALVGHRDIYLQHQPGDPNTGWLAFDARPPGAPRTCTLAWVAAPRQFRDPCRGATYPADGSGLVHYLVTVTASHRVVVDLRQQSAPGQPSPSDVVVPN